MRFGPPATNTPSPSSIDNANISSGYGAHSAGATMGDHNGVRDVGVIAMSLQRQLNVCEMMSRHRRCHRRTVDPSEDFCSILVAISEKSLIVQGKSVPSA